MGPRQCCHDWDPLGFGCDELRRIGGSHGPEEIRW
jgi:hypothetical protein